MVLLVGVAPYVDDAAEWANNFRKIHGDDAVDKFLVNGITESDLHVIAKNRGNLLKTLEVTKRADGKVVWLEEGLTEAEAMARGVRPSGWKHIREDHFPDLEANNQFAEAFDEVYRDENRIRELILDEVKYGQKVSDAGVYHYIEPNSGKILLLVIGSNGYLVTAYPFRVK
ncbi:MAG: hypothetical protein M0Q94_12765 [Candidatus Cloacimonetes bacterium]|nr:hypothetical protein [Candidatus Cloacimonadota bacterium]